MRFSDEHILGYIRIVWGRAEFQSAAANIQHYHFFWLKSVPHDSIEKNQCAHRHVLHEFKKLFHNFGTVDSEEHAGKLFDDCIRVLSHDCKKGHCLKKVRLNEVRPKEVLKAGIQCGFSDSNGTHSFSFSLVRKLFDEHCYREDVSIGRIDCARSDTVLFVATEGPTFNSTEGN